MKKSNLKIIIIVLIILLIIATSVILKLKYSNKVNENSLQSNNIEKNISKNENENFNNSDIQKLEIQIEYYNGEIEVEYEIKNNKIKKAKYINEIDNIILKDNEAIEFIKDKLLTINYKNPQSEVVDLILNNLNLKDNFIEFEVEAQYFNNDKIEFEIENNKY